jgi:hypothetical protein
MIEQWQPWWDVLLLVWTCVILTPLFIYIDRKERDNDS